jgi:diguanylate cyclase (GGDEF)-like protein
MCGGPLGSARVFAPNDCLGIQRGQVHLVEDGGQGMQCRHLHEAASPNYLCMPLRVHGEILGMLHFQGLKELIPDGTDWLQRRAETVADHVALTLTNIKLRETLQHQAIRDSLTGLFNRRYLDETMVREIHRAQRKGAPLGVIMLDLDHFKRFNDTYGHEAGDNLLRILGEFLLTQVRYEDVPCRYGGEEFVLIMPEASLDVVKARAKEIREKVPQLQVLHRGQLLESTTVSLGVAMLPDHGATVEDLLRAADDAMYQAKREGRNRVVVAEGGV